MPAGTGKNVKLCVFADKEAEVDLLELFPDIIFANDETIKAIAAGEFNFDKLIATSEQMQILKPFARTLGPKGLMPNVKSGTLVKPDELIAAVKMAKQG